MNNSRILLRTIMIQKSIVTIINDIIINNMIFKKIVHHIIVSNNIVTPLSYNNNYNYKSQEVVVLALKTCLMYYLYTAFTIICMDVNCFKKYFFPNGQSRRVSNPWISECFLMFMRHAWVGNHVIPTTEILLQFSVV